MTKEIKIRDLTAGPGGGYLPYIVEVVESGFTNMELGSAVDSYYAGMPYGIDFTVAAEGDDTINVTTQLKDMDGDDLAVRGVVRAYLSNDANGDSLATTAPSGGCAIGTDGLLIPITPSLINNVIVHGNLAVDAVPEKFKTTQTHNITIHECHTLKLPICRIFADLIINLLHMLDCTLE